MTAQLRLLRYAWPHWRGLATLLATMALGIGLDVLRPWPTKLLVDQILGHQPVPSPLHRLLACLPGPHGRDGLLVWVCVGTIVIFVAATLLSMASTVASVGLGQRMTYDLGADLFLHLQRLSLLFHSRRPVGDTIARVTGDPYCVQALVTGALLPLLQSVITLITMFAIMWRLEPTMALLSLGVVPFLLLSIRAFGRPIKRRSRAKRDLEGRMMSLVQQALSAIPAVQAFAREELEYARFRSYADDTVAAYQRTSFAQMWFKLFVGLVTTAGTASIMWLGSRYALEGKVTTGTILVFLSYLGSLYGPLSALTYLTSTLQSTAANADRVLEILDTPPDVQDLPDARDARLRGDVRYERVTFGYQLGQPVLKGISFEARAGDVIAIVGPTGAGKTTLVNLLVRFFDPWCGRVTVDGEDIRHLRVRSLRQQMAIVLQEAFIFPLTVAENIAYGRPEATREQIVAAAEAANADDFIQRLPEGYDTVVGERGATLSGGEKQRLAIARAFLKDASILILDEPTSALDARTEALLLDALERLMKGRTTIIIAHRLSTIRNADRILVIDCGEIVEQGTHSELMALGGLYASLYRHQMQITQHELLPGGLASTSEQEPFRSIDNPSPRREAHTRLPDLETLTAGITSVFKNNGDTTGQPTILERRPNPYPATYLNEIVTCQFAASGKLRLFCKYDIRLCPPDSMPSKQPTFSKPSRLYGSVLYEAEVHRCLLQPFQAASPKVYGAHTDPTTGITWLIFEYLGESVHLEFAPVQLEALGLAARWIGRFHATSQLRLSSTPLPHLGRFDAAYYLQWARQTSLFAGDLHQRYPWLAVVCQRYEPLIDLLLAQPPTVIHGDYYCDNILFHEGLVHPIDWARAAVTVGELDLAMLTHDWPEDIARHCELEYQQARWPEGPPEDFLRILDIARLTLRFRLLWKKTDWIGAQRPIRRFEVLRSLSERLGLI
jgi:ABC-type multidrug transport system fused ATPase/permease subunit